MSVPSPDTMLQICKPLVHEPGGYLNLLVRGAENVPADLLRSVLQAVAHPVPHDHLPVAGHLH